MSSIDPSILEFLSSHRHFLVLGHMEPDGDCVASQLVTARLLKRMGRSAAAFSQGPFDRPEIAPYAPLFRSTIEADDLREGTAAVVVDCSTPDRIGDLYARVSALPTLVIDHHASGRDFGTVRWVDPRAPSVTYLVQLLIEGAGVPLDAEDARLILFGLCTDTGFFRHLGPDSAPVFRAVARLVEAGGSPNDVYRRMYADRELARFRLLGQSLVRTRTYYDGRLLLTWETLEDLKGVTARGSDELYRMLQSVKGVRVVALIREESEAACSVGLRSNGEVDVGSIARSLGGGGHRAAAGFTLNARRDEAEGLVVAELRAALIVNGCKRNPREAAPGALRRVRNLLYSLPRKEGAAVAEIGNGRDGTLTRRVLAFQRTGDGLQELIEDLALRIYHFPRIRRGCGEDDCGDFYLFFFPRLIKILGRFRDQGLPFESYLHAVLGWQLRSYVRRRRQEERCWETARRPELWEEAEAGGQAREEAAPAGEGLLQGLAERLGVDPAGGDPPRRGPAAVPAVRPEAGAGAGGGGAGGGGLPRRGAGRGDAPPGGGAARAAGAAGGPPGAGARAAQPGLRPPHAAGEAARRGRRRRGARAAPAPERRAAPERPGWTGGSPGRAGGCARRSG